MCLEEHLSIAPWGVAGYGRFKTKTRIEERKQDNEIIRSYTGKGQSPLEHTVSAALEKIGNDTGASIAAVAIAYYLQRCLYVFPVVGGRKVEYLFDNFKAWKSHFPRSRLEQSSFDPGFLYSIVGMDPCRFGQTQFPLQSNSFNLAWVKQMPPIPGTPLSRT